MLPQENIFDIGETFRVQFVWQLSDGDYLRAVFTAEVLGHERGSDKYLLRLTEFVAGRQETETGQMRPPAEATKSYWALIAGLVGRKILLAYEAADGRSLPLRLATLTGEHNFFTRFE